MRTRRSSATLLALGVLIALGGLAAGGGALAAGRGPCTTAAIDERFQSPDGTVHSPGTLTICATREYSPVSWLHATYVDGMPVAMLISRRGTSEGRSPDGTPFMILLRDADGLLHLTGYAVPSGERMVTYELESSRRRQESQRMAKGNPAPPATTPTALILAAKIR